MSEKALDMDAIKAQVEVGDCNCVQCKAVRALIAEVERLRREVAELQVERRAWVLLHDEASTGTSTVTDNARYL